MADILTPKQEKFCRNIIVKQMNQSDAYRDAYDTENMKNKSIHEKASELANTVKVSSRMDDLRKEYADYFNYDAKKHFEELEQARQLSLIPKGEHGTINENAIIRSTELKGKLCGHYIEKSEVDAKVSGNISVNIITGGINGNNNSD